MKYTSSHELEKYILIKIGVYCINVRNVFR
jgi:hypothetical protein